MGTRATISFLEKLADGTQTTEDQGFLEMMIHNNTAIPDRTQAIVYGGESPLPSLLKSVEQLKPHVDFMVMTCITAYHYLEEIESHYEVDFLNPIDLTVSHLKKAYPEVDKVGLLATTGTIQTNLFSNALISSELTPVMLNNSLQESLTMQAIYMPNGLKSGEIKQEAYEKVAEAVEVLKKQGAEVIIAGCTELPLALKKLAVPIPYVDPMEVLANEVLGYAKTANKENKTEAIINQ